MSLPISDVQRRPGANHATYERQNVMKGQREGGSCSHGEDRPFRMCLLSFPHPFYNQARRICIKCVSVGHRARQLTCRAHMQLGFTSIPKPNESNCLASTNENVRNSGGKKGGGKNTLRKRDTRRDRKRERV